MIVGVDPGTTVGLAFLNVFGKLLKLESSKELPVNEVVKRISAAGEPLIVASDKSPLPETIKKIAASCSCRVWYPSESLSKDEKNTLVRAYSVQNNHEADALAAALKAYGAYSAKLRQIERQEGTDFEKNVKRRLAGERVEEAPAVIVSERRIIVERPPEDYEPRIAELKRAMERLGSDVKNQGNIIAAQRKRIAELEGGEKSNYLESQVMRAQLEKTQLEEKLMKMLSLLREKKLQVLDMRDRTKTISDEKQVLGERYTEDEETFEWCRNNNRGCTLIRILHIDEPYVYYEKLGEFEATKPGASITDIVDDYRKTRKRGI